MRSPRGVWKSSPARRRRETGSPDRAAFVSACLLAVVLTGCTRVITTSTGHPARQVGPIAATQVRDLHSNRVQDRNGNQFVKTEPESCAGIARELRPPFLVDHHPVAIDDGHWDATDPEMHVEELTAVYATDFQAKAAIAYAHEAIARCQGTPLTVTTLKGHDYHFVMSPAVTSGSPDIVLWSFRASDWVCDNGFVAAYNAAVEITVCGPTGGYDVGALTQAALKRIQALANNPA